MNCVISNIKGPISALRLKIVHYLHRFQSESVNTHFTNTLNRTSRVFVTFCYLLPKVNDSISRTRRDHFQVMTRHTILMLTYVIVDNCRNFKANYSKR